MSLNSAETPVCASNCVSCLEHTLATGVTVKAAFLTQHLHELDPTWRVLEAVEKIANHVELGNGKSLSASQLCERLGFDRDLQWTPIRDLSGGEKRRLQLTRLLMNTRIRPHKQKNDVTPAELVAATVGAALLAALTQLTPLPQTHYFFTHCSINLRPLT